MLFQRILPFRSDGAVYQGKPLKCAVLISDGWVELLGGPSILELHKKNRAVAVLELSDPWVLEHIHLPMEILQLIERRFEPAKDSMFESIECETAATYLQARAFAALQCQFLGRSHA